MKSIFLFIAFLLLINFSQAQKVILNSDGIQVNVLQSDENVTLIEYKVGEYVKRGVNINGQTYYHVELPGEPSINEKGNPDLAKLSRSIVIPGNALMSVSVTSSDYVETDLQVAPSKGILSRLVDPSKVPYTFSSVYSTGYYYPSARAELGEPYIIRDERGITVNVFPFAYNPVTKKLRIYTYLLIEVRNTGSDSRNTLSKAGGINTYFKNMYENQFINYNLFETRLVSETGRMLIISANNYVDEMQPLVNWKNQIGLPTEIVSTSQTGSTANAIFNYIQNEYNENNGLAFVLFVGDFEQIPAFLVTTTDCNLNPVNVASDPSYSLLSGSDNYPEIIIGRFSASTEAQVTTHVTKTIYYERDMPEENWWHNGLGIGSDDYYPNPPQGDDSEYDWQHMRNIRADLLNWHYSSVAELYEGSQGGNDASGDPTAAMVSTSVNNGVSLINYTGHGCDDRWGTTGFNITNVNALTNDDELPFIFSVACLNGWYNGRTCFAEAWLRATNPSTGRPTGAVAMYAASVSLDWQPPMEAQDEFNRLLVNSANTTFGALCYNGSWSMIDDYGTNGAENFLGWNIFGDPSLTVIPHSANSCPENLGILENLSGGTHNFEANTSITASNIISNLADVHYGANTNVRLNTGFRVFSGSHFLGNLDGCSSSLKSTGTYTPISNKEIREFENNPINEISEEVKVTIYPNPSFGIINIDLTGNIESFTVEITDIAGKSLLNTTVQGNSSQLKLSDLGSGVHFIRITTENKTFIEKLILK